MLTLRCKICLETMSEKDTPMATQCGHIYCLDCATFHFSAADPFCAVCRAPQSLENLVRLYPDTNEGSTQGDASDMVEGEQEQLSSSPVSVKSIERAGQEAMDTVKKAIAGREDMEDALLACNTFVNSVTPRERAHINTDLLRDIAFQLTLVQTVLKDNQEEVTRLQNEVEQARAAENKARAQVEQQRRRLRRAEKEQLKMAQELEAQQERYQLISQQCIVATEDASRQRLRAAKAENALEEMDEELRKWRESATKNHKKYYALKNEMKLLKQAANGGSRRGHARNGSDELEVV
ncbi:hypothetical protein C8Q77DRAFT_1167761 [Trametes polyzona]|nr:hypothetical protein C8Q77DRAFT_1167761 [Trametes polyzona]